LTEKHQTFKEKNGPRIYGDTPGLDDVKKREKASKEIKLALQKHTGNYALFFVVTLDGGRVKPSDIVTINIVIEALSDLKPLYNIIINKLDEEDYENLSKKRDAELNKASLFECFATADIPTASIYFNRLDENKARRNKDYVPTLDEYLIDFIYEKALVMKIKPELVKDLNIKTSEERLEIISKKLDDQTVKFKDLLAEKK